MSVFNDNQDQLKKREESVNELRKQRRLNEIRKKVDNYNDTHNVHQIRLFEVPEKLTFEQFKDSHVFPYRSANKLKSIYNNFEQANLLNRMTQQILINCLIIIIITMLRRVNRNIR